MSNSVRGAVQVTGGGQADMTTCYVRKQGKIRQAIETRSELLPHLGNPCQLTLVLLQCTQKGLLEAIPG